MNPHVDTSTTVDGDFARRYQRLDEMNFSSSDILVMDLLQFAGTVSHESEGFNVAMGDLSVSFRNADPVIALMGPDGEQLRTSFSTNWQLALEALEQQ